MTESCKVVKDNGKTAVIEIRRQPKCDGCHACAFNKRDYIRVPAIKDCECAVGDTVIVQMPEKQIELAPLFLFVIPLILTFIAVYISRDMTMWKQIAIIVPFLTAGLVILYVADKLFRRRRKFMPVITGQDKGANND